MLKTTSFIKTLIIFPLIATSCLDPNSEKIKKVFAQESSPESNSVNPVDNLSENENISTDEQESIKNLKNAETTIFYENFDRQPDWTSTLHTLSQSQSIRTNHILPDGWTDLYQGTQWSPELGLPDKHASLEILDVNHDKTRNSSKKSAVMWRESYSRGWKNWASDSQLVKYLDKSYKEIYGEFYIRFSPNFYGINNVGSWASKIFRIGSYRGTGSIVSGYQNDLGPIFIWDYKHDQYGVRNVYTTRGGPWGENYYFPSGEDISGSYNFSSHTKAHGINGSDPKLPDQVNGGFVLDGETLVDHEQVFGDANKWTKVAFYLRMNSAPGVKDGEMRQWINDVQITHKEEISWVSSNIENKMVGWNYFAIGGNDYFQAFPNEDQFEDWYAIDDVLIATKPPDGLIP